MMEDGMYLESGKGRRRKAICGEKGEVPVDRKSQWGYRTVVGESSDKQAGRPEVVTRKQDALIGDGWQLCRRLAEVGRADGSGRSKSGPWNHWSHPGQQMGSERGGCLWVDAKGFAEIGGWLVMTVCAGGM